MQELIIKGWIGMVKGALMPSISIAVQAVKLKHHETHIGITKDGFKIILQS